jgi:hypothetical protein
MGQVLERIMDQFTNKESSLPIKEVPGEPFFINGVSK